MEQVLAGHVAIVTGASRGLGRQIALDFARAGAAVAVVARSAEKLDALVADIQEAGGRALACPGDVTDRSAVEAAVAATEAQFGPISLLVNNAGVDRPYGPVDAADPDAWWDAFSIHMRGALLFMHAVLPGMKAEKRGRIINMSSSASTVIVPNFSCYCVAKSSLNRLTEHVALEVADDGIAVFAIHPGMIMTDLGRNALSDPEAHRWAKPLIDILSAAKDSDPQPALERLARQCIELASGRYDALSGRYLDLDTELAVHLENAD